MKSDSHRTARIVVDSSGIWCPPTPLTDLFKAWRKAELGDLIELRANEPNIEADVRAWARKSGNRLVDIRHDKDNTKLVIKVTRKGKEILELSAAKKSMNQPDETKDTPKARLQLVTMGDFTFGLRTLAPGWRWTTSMRPIAKTETCNVRHIGYVISGRMRFLMYDGTELKVGPGEAFDVKARHDTWTVGDHPVVFIDLIDAAKPPSTF